MRGALPVLLLLFAGCIDPGPGDAADEDAHAASLEWETSMYEGAATSIDGVVVGMRPVSMVGEEPPVTFDVRNGAETLLVTVDADGTIGQSRLGVSLWPPSCHWWYCGHAERGDGTVTFDLSDPQAGTWVVQVFADGPPGDRFEYEVTVEVQAAPGGTT